MAAKLKDENSNVHVLAPRKAKGAGGQKRKGPSTTRLKPAAGTAAAATPRQPSDADIRRGQQDRLIALHAKHRTVENREAVASEALSEIRGDKKLIRAAIQNAGFPLELYDESNKELKLKTKKVDLAQKEEIRALIREAFGLPVGPTPKLDLEGVPEAAKPALHWESVGYFDGINGEASDPTKAGAPPENLQDYMRGYSQAMARNGAGIKMLESDPKPDTAPPLMVGEKPEKAAAKAAAKKADKEASAAADAEPVITAEPTQPDWTGFADDHSTWSDEQVEVFMAWFKGLDPDADIDIVHLGVAAAFDAAVAAEAGEDVAAPAADAAGFETPAAELAAQAPRKAVQERRAAEVGGESEQPSEFVD